MRLDTKSSKQDRYSVEATSARALTERCAPIYKNKLNVPLDIADVVRDVEIRPVTLIENFHIALLALPAGINNFPVGAQAVFHFLSVILGRLD